MKKIPYSTAFVIALASINTAAMADGIISTVVNSPLSATGTLAGSRVGINIYLQRSGAMGADFMDPNVIGYGIPKGGRLEVEMSGGYERDWDVGISQSSMMLVTGTPQQGLPGKKVGYKIAAGDNENTLVVTPTGENGLVAEKTMSPAPGAKGDPVRQRGLKVLHVGFLQSAFLNTGKSGTVTVRFVDAAGKVVATGTETIEFLKTPRAQILPTNFPNKRRNHNWQTVSPGAAIELPLTYMVYGQSIGTDTESHYAFKGGMEGLGVVAGGKGRFKDGLLVRDTNGDGRLDVNTDTIVGGVNISAPDGASGQSLQNMMKDGKAMLSVDTAKMAPKPGKRWGGSMMMLSFKAGSAAGKYRATVSLLNKPGDMSSGDGSSYTYTVIAK